MTAENAHGKSTETGSVVLSMDGRTLLTRGGDDTVKSTALSSSLTNIIAFSPLVASVAWDIRSFKIPLYTVGGLTTLYPGMNAIWSPDEKYVVLGSGTPPSNGRAAGGRLSFLKREGLTVVEEMEMTSCVVKVAWHSKINQVSFHTYNGPIRVKYVGWLVDSLWTHTHRSSPPTQTAPSKSITPRILPPTAPSCSTGPKPVGRTRSKTPRRRCSPRR